MNNIFLNFWNTPDIIYWDFNINTQDILSNQLYELKEDLAQVAFLHGTYKMDIGYYPEFSVDWKLQLLLLKNDDWINYLEKLESNDIIDLQNNIDILINKYKLDSSVLYD